MVPRAARRDASRWFGDNVLGADLNFGCTAFIGVNTLVGMDFGGAGTLRGSASVCGVAPGGRASVCAVSLGLNIIRDRAPCEHLVPVYTIYPRANQRT